MADVNIREAKKTDAKMIYKLIQQQAEEQNSVLPPHLTCDALEEGGWGPTAVLLAFVAERMGAMEGELQGYILAHHSYSACDGRSMCIKDIYVIPAARRSGVAMGLSKGLLQAAVSMGCMRCDVFLNKTNRAGVGLFEKLGAENITEAEDWHFFSMDSKAMTEMKTRCESHGPPQVRPAGTEDMPSVMAMIRELADYSKMPAPKINAHTLATDASPSGTFYDCFVAESDGKLVGYVMSYHTFSCKGRGIYMEDFYVKPTHRGQGLGTALMAQVAQHGLALGASHLDFVVLSWNTPSIAFYQHKGAMNLTASIGVHRYRFRDFVMRKYVQQD